MDVLKCCTALMQVCTLTVLSCCSYSTYPMHVIFLSLCSMLETVVSVNDVQNFPYFQKEKTFTGQTATVNNCKHCHVVSMTGNKFSGSPQIFFIFQYLWIFYMLHHISEMLQKWKWNRSHTRSSFLPVIQSFGCSWPDDGAVWAFSPGTLLNLSHHQ